MQYIISRDHNVNLESRPLDHSGSAGGLAPYKLGASKPKQP